MAYVFVTSGDLDTEPAVYTTKAGTREDAVEDWLLYSRSVGWTDFPIAELDDEIAYFIEIWENGELNVMVFEGFYELDEDRKVKSDKEEWRKLKGIT